MYTEFGIIFGCDDYRIGDLDGNRNPFPEKFPTRVVSYLRFLIVNDEACFGWHDVMSMYANSAIGDKPLACHSRSPKIFSPRSSNNIRCRVCVDRLHSVRIRVLNHVVNIPCVYFPLRTSIQQHEEEFGLATICNSYTK